jgi:eukaryotic-like serine/threonine-protein kinase
MDHRNLAGASLAGCALEELIGRGSMGSIYRGRHIALDRAVAVKAFSVASGDPAEVDRLLAEARAIAKVEDPNVVQVYDVGVQDNLLYIVMQFLQGQTLKARFEETGAFPVEDVYPIIADVARGLQAIHDRGIVHRDLKMENVIVGPDGRARITDFGLVLEKGAKDEYKGRIVGTPAYISPEQWIGRPLDARADLYALGVMLYALSAGVYPFAGPGAKDFREQHTSIRPQKPSEINPLMGESLSLVTLKLLSKIRDKRYATAKEFLDDLQRCRDGKTPEAAKRTVKGLKCPFCETVNAPGEKKCTVCGETLRAMAVSLDLQMRSGEFSCPGCGGVCEDGSRACPRCGKGICTKCRRALAVVKDLCVLCGPPAKKK